MFQLALEKRYIYTPRKGYNELDLSWMVSENR